MTSGFFSLASAFARALPDRRVNFIAVDFVGSGDLFAVVERSNGVDV